MRGSVDARALGAITGGRRLGAVDAHDIHEGRMNVAARGLYGIVLREGTKDDLLAYLDGVMSVAA